MPPISAADTAGASDLAPKRLTLNAEVIACGLPGTLMPGWAKGAYVERPCFGETGGVPEGLRVVGAYDDQQLADLIAYINSTFRKNFQE